MIRGVFLFLFLFVFHGCNIADLFLQKEVDRVTVVKYTPYTKHHRIFLSRSNLDILPNGRKYLYLYHKKNGVLGVMVKKKNRFLLYTLSRPQQKIYFFYPRETEGFDKAVRHFQSKGYKPVASVSSNGFTVSVSNQRYKGIKTLLFETKEYKPLLRLYKKAIREYNADIIKPIKTQLPKSLILSYYKRYEKKAKNKKQLDQIHTIAKKLGIKIPESAKKPTKQSVHSKFDIKEKEPQQTDTKHETNTKQSAPKNEKTKSLQDNAKTKMQNHKIQDKQQSMPKHKVIPKNKDTKDKKDKKEIKPKPAPMPYTYYLYSASLDELQHYLSEEKNKKLLPEDKYITLQQRQKKLKEAQLLKEGSLEDLIAEYKRNKKAKFKERILFLMKEKLQHQ